MAGTAVAVGVCILILMFAATILSVTFATRGAMATNKAVIEVLHFVGAKNGYIARHFQHHFLVLGLQGGAIGGGAAIILFAAAAVMGRWLSGGDQTSALFGSFSIGLAGYAAVLGQVLLIAVVTALTSRHTVNSTLEMID
jgi:cell division transport system permease protein